MVDELLTLTVLRVSRIAFVGASRFGDCRCGSTSSVVSRSSFVGRAVGRVVASFALRPRVGVTWVLRSLFIFVLRSHVVIALSMLLSHRLHVAFRATPPAGRSIQCLRGILVVVVRLGSPWRSSVCAVLQLIRWCSRSVARRSFALDFHASLTHVFTSCSSLLRQVLGRS